MLSLSLSKESYFQVLVNEINEKIIEKKEFMLCK